MTRVFTFVNCSLSSATLQIAVQASIQPAISLSRIHLVFSLLKCQRDPLKLSLKLAASSPLTNRPGPKRTGLSRKHPFFRGKLSVSFRERMYIMFSNQNHITSCRFAGNMSSTYSITNCMFVYLDPKLHCLVLHSVHHKVLHACIIWYP